MTMATEHKALKRKLGRHPAGTKITETRISGVMPSTAMLIAISEHRKFFKSNIHEVTVRERTEINIFFTTAMTFCEITEDPE